MSTQTLKQIGNISKTKLKIETPAFHNSPSALQKTRQLISLISFSCFISPIFLFGPIGFLKGLNYFTVWNEVLTFLAIFLVTFLTPITEKKERWLLDIQHAACVGQFLVVFGYWILIFPQLGWGRSADGPHREFIIFLMVYKHVFPFICKNFFY